MSRPAMADYRIKIGFWMLFLRALCHDARVKAIQQQHQQRQGQRRKIALTACEILWDSSARTALRLLRHTPDYNEAEPFVASALAHCCYDDGQDHRFVALTLVGGKGGKPLDQVNQDRGFIHYRNSSVKTNDVLLAGVADGHGASGHFVAEYIRHTLSQRILTESSSLGTSRSQPTTKTNKTQTPFVVVEDVIADMVKSLDQTVPARFGHDSGATLSFLVRVGETLYVSNTGDSQTFVAAAIVDETDNQHHELVDVNIVFASEPHKPTGASERRRLEALGHVVDDAEDRVWYKVAGDKGGHHGMATSRTIGDHQAGVATLIPDPDVVKLTIRDILKDQTTRRLLVSPNSTILWPSSLHQPQQVCTGDVRPDGSVDTLTCDEQQQQQEQQHDSTAPTCRGGGERIHLFAVSATDGILDYIKPEAMAYQLAQALYEGRKKLITTTEDIVHQSAAQWIEEMHGEYRDDITITVAHIC